MHKRVSIVLTEEAERRLRALAAADNCTTDAIVEHLLMGRLLVKHGAGVVPELDPILRVAKMIQRDLKADAGHVSIAVEAELDDVLIAAEIP